MSGSDTSIASEMSQGCSKPSGNGQAMRWVWERTREDQRRLDHGAFLVHVDRRSDWSQVRCKSTRVQPRIRMNYSKLEPASN